MKTQKLARLLRYSLIFVFILGLFLTPFCHWCFKEFLSEIFSYDNPTEKLYIGIEIYTFGIALMFIVTQLMGICSRVEKNEAFTQATVGCLRRIKICSLAAMTVYIIRFIIIHTFDGLPAFLLGLSFLLAAVFTMVIEQLFKQATEIREENSLMV